MRTTGSCEAIRSTAAFHLRMRENFFLKKYIYIKKILPISSCIFPVFLGQTGIVKTGVKKGGRQTDGQRDGQFV